ncbi:MAG: hypothetical protein C5B60_03730 [Chloroflexi bacterium]|nr:MAG: hypothetical protein C5B60_03730 [Chloroflexota bacterium]
MKGKIIVFGQFVFIVLFVYALSSEYRANVFQQEWVTSNAWPLEYLLNGYLAASLIGVTLGGAVLLLADYIRERNRRRLNILA